MEIEKISWNWGIFLIIAGLAIAAMGIFVVWLAMRYVGKGRIALDNGVIDCHETSSSDERPFAIVTRDVQGLEEHVDLCWKEQKGRPVECEIRELPPRSLTGQYVTIYVKGTGAQGSLSRTLSRGAYIIEFKSTNHEFRKVSYELRAIEYRKPFKEHLPIGLTLLTIGTVLAVNGLNIFLRG